MKLLIFARPKTLKATQATIPPNNAALLNVMCSTQTLVFQLLKMLLDAPQLLVVAAEAAVLELAVAAVAARALDMGLKANPITTSSLELSMVMSSGDS
mmetsp:Transcript_2793/g.5645  ORF Transcript_2793/g.5645 Transcript_2793/m.5645 type:complete len:98 (+) Transcript_2793:245-538(+)|eukprot:CAMPEP_0171639258 /NCGR_PEP_ID=MMETSP0990-20121206/29590_1 /TAXON_ID=483369 /ORGANISM="non described non described, Strain CCMP2098" /LENGTH=97 /DNA_ID=CAMNT_0012212929 /DNA_START=170 /DNA_END=463 /DNA_ORIENTATION=+